MRAVYYLARRRLGLSPAQWNALAWWEQRLYIEGLEEEFNNPEHRPSQQTDGVVFSNRPGEMARVGFTERQLS